MFRHIYIRIFLMLLLISLSLTGAFLLYYFEFFLSGTVLLVISISLFLMANRIARKGYREVNDFLTALQFRDTSSAPSTSKSPRSLRELFETIKKVREQYQEINKNREESLVVLKEIVEKVPVGIIAVNESGELLVFNSEGCRLLETGRVKNIERLKKLRPVFFERVSSMVVGGSTMISYQRDKEDKKIFIRKSFIATEGNGVSILVFHEMDSEYGAMEMKSWDKLLGILTHEIANSVTAITSLSQSALDLVKDDENQSEDLIRAVGGVKRRSDKLFQFVKDYRSLAEIPDPTLEAIELYSLLQALSEEWRLNHPTIQITVSCPKNLVLRVDEGQLILCLENFMLNSVYALSDQEKPEVRVEVDFEGEDFIHLRFQDNGSGMDGDVERAVVPFFTTRKEGKGIGLALARQIMRSHGGTLSARNLDPGFEIFIRLPLNKN